MAIPALALAAVLLLAHPASAQYTAGGYTGGYSTSSGGYGTYGAYIGAYYGVESGILPPIQGLPMPVLPPVEVPVLPPVLGLPLPIGRKLLAATTDEVPRQRHASSIRGRSLLQSFGYGSGGSYGSSYGYYGSYGSYAISGGVLYVYGG